MSTIAVQPQPSGIWWLFLLQGLAGILLGIMLLGIAFLVRAYHIGATEPGSAGYQSVLSILLAAVTGRGWFYWTGIWSIVVVLALSANTAFADFPRLRPALAAGLRTALVFPVMRESEVLAVFECYASGKRRPDRAAWPVPSRPPASPHAGR